MKQGDCATIAAPDPDLEIRGVGEGGRADSQKNFLALRASVLFKHKGGPGASPGSATVLDAYVAVVWTGFGYRKLISTPPPPFHTHL